jgi:hypothetical protein
MTEPDEVVAAHDVGQQVNLLDLLRAATRADVLVHQGPSSSCSPTPAARSTGPMSDVLL